MNEPAKNCPACAEEIKVAAKLCPYCRTKQVRFALWREELIPVVGFLLLMMGFGGFMALWDPDLDPTSRRIVSHGGDLAVAGVMVEPGGKPDEVYCIGTVTNRGMRPWRVHTLEIAMRDADGNLVDAMNPAVDRPFVVLPQQVGDFRLTVRSGVASRPGLVVTVRVQACTDGNRPFFED